MLSAGGEHAQLFLTLFVMYVAAKLAAEIFERLKQPAVAGEILAGILIGPSVLGWVAPSDLTNAWSEIGVVFLLFLVGLETKPSDIFRVVGELRWWRCWARAINRLRPRVERLRVGPSWLVFGFSMCLALVLLAQHLGVAAIIGAFLAGMSLSETTEDMVMPHQAETVTEF